jgi:hypothetical protein
MSRPPEPIPRETPETRETPDTPETEDLTGFDVDLSGTEGLREEERLVLLRLVNTGLLTEARAAQALAIHRRTGSPLLDILGAVGGLRQRDYAENIAAVTRSAFGSPLIGKPELAVDVSLAQRFSPAVLMRHLFFPLAHTGDFVTVLAVHPEDGAVEPAVRTVLPGVDVVAPAPDSEPGRLLRTARGAPSDPLIPFRQLSAVLDGRVQGGQRVLLQGEVLFPLVALLDLGDTLLLPSAPEYGLAVQRPAAFATYVVLAPPGPGRDQLAAQDVGWTERLPDYELLTDVRGVRVYVLRGASRPPGSVGVR